ncbi:short neuropeptide F [Venturia canescens]|uniref:short neuropeptide F n=1 Tax=Venturia canescens TaxID=32260 RepID=UPI001C9C9A35|nr:short neuropeptide F-like [Venturia canescens]
MMNNRNSSLLMLLLIIGIVVASESYLDYGDEATDRNLENLREFYKVLLRRNSVENMPPMVGSPYEHLMIRKSQRSPSLRLRFGRSGPAMTSGILTRPVNGQSTFDDN